MYQTPRMMVPVRTWQHRQQLVEYQRSHGEIIILSALSQPREHLQTEAVFMKKETPLSGDTSTERRSAPKNDEQDSTASDLTVTYHCEQLNETLWSASNHRQVKM